MVYGWYIYTYCGLYTNLANYGGHHLMVPMGSFVFLPVKPTQLSSHVTHPTAAGDLTIPGNNWSGLRDEIDMESPVADQTYHVFLGLMINPYNNDHNNPKKH